MQTISLGVSPLTSSRLSYGCWRVADNKEDPGSGRRAVLAAYEAGYTLFDNANIYGGGEAEKVMGAALKEIPEMRRRVLVLTKCGVRHGGHPTPDAPNRWDFSFEHIVDSCEQSLKRLGVDAIDIFMLHRPDFLADPNEIAKAFEQLRAAGKARYFAVSNFRPTLVAALLAACPMPLILHQVEISLAKLDAFTDGTLDQCSAERITPMAWSPLAAGLIGDGAKRLLPAQKNYRPEKFLAELDAIAAVRGVGRTVIALSWLLKHPSKIIPIVGSINPDRIREAAKAPEIELTREEWYRLLNAARGEPLP
ncbi:MAG TPA: aldo/keto reductase [Verrucomicrobiae bacterium]|jgi:predicted oxidoreductase|nr:aldo/keto reductase [Verrucomicrobiae bacterium]